jgi:hypothetical protein
LPAVIRVPLIVLVFFVCFMLTAMAVSAQINQPHASDGVYLFGFAFTAGFAGAFGASRLLGRPKPIRNSQIALSSRPEELIVAEPADGPPDLSQQWLYFTGDYQGAVARSTIFACGCFPALGLAYALPALGIPALLLLLAFFMINTDKGGHVIFDSQRKGLILKAGGGERFYAADDLFLVGTDYVAVPDPDEGGTVSRTVPAIVTRQGQILRVGEPGDSPVSAGAAGRRIAGALGLPTMFGDGKLRVESVAGKGVAVYYVIDHPPAVDPEATRKRAVLFQCWLPLIGMVIAFLATMMTRSQ